MPYIYIYIYIFFFFLRNITISESEQRKSNKKWMEWSVKQRKNLGAIHVYA